MVEWPLPTSSCQHLPCSLCSSHTSFWCSLLSCSFPTSGPLLMLSHLSWIFFTSAHPWFYVSLQSKHSFLREAFVTTQTYLHSFLQSGHNFPLQALISGCKHITIFVLICCSSPPPHYEYRNVKIMFVLLIKVPAAPGRGCGIEEKQIYISQLNQWANGRGR